MQFNTIDINGVKVFYREAGDPKIEHQAATRSNTLGHASAN